MKHLLTFLLLAFFCLNSATVLAQFADSRLLDQRIRMINNREAPDAPLTSDLKGEFVALNDDEKANYLQSSLREIAVARYDKYAGDPYLYKEFKNAIMFDGVGHRFVMENINYNAYSGRLEYKQGENHVSFQPAYFPKVEFEIEAGNLQSLVLGLLPDFPGQFSMLIYKGEKFSMAMHRKIRIMENKGFTTGKKHIADKQFFPDDSYHLYFTDGWQVVSPKPKALGKALGWEIEIKSFIKENKLNPKDQADLVRILEFAESL